MAAPSSFSADRIGSAKIAISTHLQNGYGDLICALKVAAIFHEKLKVPKENILISVYRLEDERYPKEVIEALNSKHHFEILSAADTSERTDVAFSLAVPYENSMLYLVDMKKVPTAAIVEYGHPKTMISCDCFMKASFGLAEAAKEEIGILISDELKAWGFSEESKDPIQRLGQLVKASDAVRGAIFGKATLKAEDLTGFNEKCKLYYGYTHQDTIFFGFMEAIAKMNKEIEDKRDLCFVCPLNKETIRKRLSDPTHPQWPEFNAFLDRLSAAGISGIEIKSFDGETLFTQGDPSTKKVTLLVGTIPYDDTNLLLMASEKETVVTGDQSLSEAISANKCFFYETLSHKERLAKDLEDL